MFKSVLCVLLFSAIASAAINKITDVTVKDLDGKDVSFSPFAGKCVMIINTASGCGFTKPNMNYLNELTKRHPELVIVAFPSNTFGQEKKTNEQLKTWFFEEWSAKYNVYAPVDVKESDVYKFLIKQSGNKTVWWNYGKYVVEKDGTTVERYNAQAGAVFSSGLDAHLKRCVNA